MKRHVAILSSLLLLLALWAVPASAGYFWHAGDQKLNRGGSSVSCPSEDGWVKLSKPEAYALTNVPTQFIKPSGDGTKPVEMTAPEKAAVLAGIATRNYLAKLIGLSAHVTGQENYREMLETAKARLVAAGKKVGEIDVKIADATALIAGAEAKIVEALKDLP